MNKALKNNNIQFDVVPEFPKLTGRGVKRVGYQPRKKIIKKDLEKQELLKIILAMKWQITYQLVKVVVALDLV